MNTMRHLILAALLLPTAALAQAGSSRLLNPLASLDKATLKGFVERPLFEPSRRPPVLAAPLVNLPPSPAMVQPPMLRLIGIVEGLHSLSAVVHRSDINATETLHTGDHLGVWVIEVLPDTLRVASGDRAFEYAMFRDGARSGPTPVPPASGPR